MTSDIERNVVLEQNDALRERFKHSKPELFQRLRRCCICLLASCEDQAACRAEFARWAENQWDDAVDEALSRRTIDSPTLSNLTVR